MVGTMKGAFLVRSSSDRKRWDWGGPYFPGHAFYAMAFDGRDGHRRVFAAPESMHFGSLMRWTDDFGKTWTNPEAANVRFPGAREARSSASGRLRSAASKGSGRSTAVSSPLLSSSLTMAEKIGRSCEGSMSTLTEKSGSRVEAVSACTPS